MLDSRVANETDWRFYDVAGIDDWKQLGENYLNALDDGTREWREELGNVDEDAIVWQPTPGFHSIGALILHIADVEVWWLHVVLGGRPYPEALRKKLLSEDTNQDDVQWPTPPRMPLAEYFAIHDEVRRGTAEVLSQPFDPKGVYENERYRSRMTNRWILSHTLTHESYHGGQAVLLALMHERMAKPR